MAQRNCQAKLLHEQKKDLLGNQTSKTIGGIAGEGRSKMIEKQANFI